jgi:UDP-galactopyranose mutase
MTNVRDIETDTLIIGAGPAGLAAALELSKRGKQFVVLEKEASVGGLSRTYTFRERDLEFHTDNGPHRFFSKNPYLYEVIGALLKDDWIQVRRQTRQYIDGKFYDYPINFKQAFRNIGGRFAPQGCCWDILPPAYDTPSSESPSVVSRITSSRILGARSVSST